MSRHRAIPPSLSERVFTVPEAVSAGVTKRRLRGSDLAAPFFAVRVAAATAVTPSISTLAHAFAVRLASDQFFSHLTAATLLGLRLPERHLPLILDVAVLAPARLPRLRGIRGHQLMPSARIETLPDGLRVSSAVDTWCQLAAVLQLDELIVMGDGLLQREHPLASRAELVSTIDAWGHRPGVTNLREALLHLRARTDSARETMLRLIVIRAGFPEPVVNHKIYNRFGALIAHGDLAFPEYRVLLEYDGAVHRQEHQFHVDIARLDGLMEERWRVIRVDKQLMAARATLLGKVHTALTAAGWRG
ncbi:hypothetical protein [Frigoribacterium sp. CG_9.8]|uniref:hypothetical protein n=1 Tax=Frigoribacterium sp. CG_9.8 TaxID=2787733 RepID=UPI0018CB692D|nr:hypothetical protein [Frigoribacterium sp. CG_9.8]MBG6108573.1 hypothetical protein [Frigoribacterium sp. CG_9.8]